MASIGAVLATYGAVPSLLMARTASTRGVRPAAGGRHPVWSRARPVCKAASTSVIVVGGGPTWPGSKAGPVLMPSGTTPPQSLLRAQSNGDRQIITDVLAGAGLMATLRRRFTEAVMSACASPAARRIPR